MPREFKYEVIPGVKKQFEIVKGLLNRPDVDTIYVCTDSGREGEYIYRLVAQMAGVRGKVQKRVWIDSQTEEEILRIVTADPSVREPHNLRTRRIGASIAVEVHVRVDGDMTVRQSHALTEEIERRLRERFGEGTMIAVHVEPVG